MYSTSKLAYSIVLIGFFVAATAAIIFATTLPAKAKEKDRDENDDKHMVMENSNEFSREVLSDRATNTPAHLTINKQGKVTLQSGEVTESNWPNLKVKAWGTVYNIHVMPDAKIIGNTNTGTTTPLVTVTVGDKVDLVGDVELATGLIHAKSFRNRSTVNKQSSEIQVRIKSLLEEIEKLRIQLNDIRKNAGAALGHAFGR